MKEFIVHTRVDLPHKYNFMNCQCLNGWDINQIDFEQQWKVFIKSNNNNNDMSWWNDNSQ